MRPTEKSAIINTNSPMENNSHRAQSNPTEDQNRLDGLFLAYREACPDPEAGANFMPGIWSKIEAREVSSNWFGRVAKALVTAAVAASVILGLMMSSANHSNEFFNATFVDALQADRVATLEPLHIERISALESQ
jgi:hypothetical protein